MCNKGDPQQCSTDKPVALEFLIELEFRNVGSSQLVHEAITTLLNLHFSQSLAMLSASAQTKPSSLRSAVKFSSRWFLAFLCAACLMRGPTPGVKIAVLVPQRSAVGAFAVSFRVLSREHMTGDNVLREKKV